MKVYNSLYFALFFIDKIFKKVILSTKGVAFCFLANIRSFILNRKITFYYDKLSSLYFVEDNNIKRYFAEEIKKYSYFFYCRGLSERAKSIGDAYFLPNIKFADNDIVIDCGANIGDLNLYFELNYINIKYIGIEPSPIEYFCLVKNVCSSKTMNIGLWSENCKLNFFVSSYNADSSFINQGNFDDLIKVQANRLDFIIHENIKLIKIDAEGAEPEVLIGCQNLLHKTDYISVDLGPERGVTKNNTIASVSSFLYKNNFEIIEFNVNRYIALFKRIS